MLTYKNIPILYRQIVIMIFFLMADEIYIEKLRKGVVFWNTWRFGSSINNIDLSDIDLQGEFLIGIDFHGVDLSNANLRYTQLTGANLSGTKLNNTDLSYAHLREANLAGADLTNTILTGVHLSSTRFLNTRIRNCTGLEFIDYQYTSFVDYGTLKYSDDLPKEFLYQGGLNDWEISVADLNNENLKPLELAAILKKIYKSHSSMSQKFYSCFISYSHDDKKFAHKLYDKLSTEGITCWLDNHQFLPGDDMLDKIHEGINSLDKVLLCCSKSSLNSYWVNTELDKALMKEQVLWEDSLNKTLALIPLNIDNYIFEWNSSRKSELMKRYIEDLVNWEELSEKFDYAVNRLITALSIPDNIIRA